MGQTQRSKYETDAGTIVNIRISPQSLGVLSNSPPAGAVDDANLYAFASNPGSRKKKELNARGVVVERFLGTGLARKRLTSFIPILTPTVWEGIEIDADVTLGSNAYKVASKIAEA